MSNAKVRESVVDLIKICEEAERDLEAYYAWLNKGAAESLVLYERLCPQIKKDWNVSD